MKYQTITIVSRIESDLQAWTFEIREDDLFELSQKYETDGLSVRGDLENVLDEIKETFGRVTE